MFILTPVLIASSHLSREDGTGQVGLMKSMTSDLH